MDSADSSVIMQKRATTDESAVAGTGWKAFHGKAIDQAMVKNSMDPKNRSRADNPVKQTATSPGAIIAPIQML